MALSDGLQSMSHNQSSPYREAFPLEGKDPTVLKKKVGKHVGLHECGSTSTCQRRKPLQFKTAMFAGEPVQTCLVVILNHLKVGASQPLMAGWQSLLDHGSNIFYAGKF
jgi:hypothetical protein